MTVKKFSPSDPDWMETLNAVHHDFYHLPKYVELEARRMQGEACAIRVSEGENILFVPFIIRKCPSFGNGSEQVTAVDITPPYGYAGLLMNKKSLGGITFQRNALEALNQSLKAMGVVTAFIPLHPILSAHIAENLEEGAMFKIGRTVSIDLTSSLEDYWKVTRKSKRNEINRCHRQGMTARMVPYEENIDIFKTVYQDTMGRVEAKDSYFFDDEYFESLPHMGADVKLCLVEMEDTVIAACIFLGTNDLVQAHLGGSLSEYMKFTPFSFLFDFARRWYREKGYNRLHLGGGLGGREDALLSFKRGFSRDEHPWCALRWILDEEQNHDLVNQCASTSGVTVEELESRGYFPVYLAN